MKFCSLALFSLGLVGAGASATAAPILYNINFTGGSPNPTSGSFQYDPSTFTFSSFLVTWNTFTFDLTAAANSPYSIAGTCATAAPDGQDVFNWLIATTPCGPHDWRADPNAFTPSQYFSLGPQVPMSNEVFLFTVQSGPGGPPAAFTEGTFTVTAAVPEPSSLPLVLTGCAWLAWRRRSHTTRDCQ